MSEKDRLNEKAEKAFEAWSEGDMPDDLYKARMTDIRRALAAEPDYDVDLPEICRRLRADLEYWQTVHTEAAEAAIENEYGFTDDDIDAARADGRMAALTDVLNLLAGRGVKLYSEAE